MLTFSYTHPLMFLLMFLHSQSYLHTHIHTDDIVTLNSQIPTQSHTFCVEIQVDIPLPVSHAVIHALNFIYSNTFSLSSLFPSYSYTFIHLITHQDLHMCIHAHMFTFIHADTINTISPI